MNWKLVYTKQAQKDPKKLNQAGLKDKAIIILDILTDDPLQSPPPFERLVGDLSGTYCR